MSRHGAWVVRWRDHYFQMGPMDDSFSDCIVTSVGFLVHEDHDWFVLAQSVNEDGEPEEILRLLKATILNTSPLWEEGGIS